MIDKGLLCAFLLIVTARVSPILGGDPILSGEALVYKSLIENYGPKIRPPPYNKPTPVQMEYLPVKLVYLKHSEQEMAMAAVILVRWQDKTRLSWNPFAYNMTYTINIPMNEIWYPPIAHLRSTDGNYNIAQEAKECVLIAADGTVMWLSGDTFLSSCVFDVTYFPFDVQRCKQRFMPWPDQSKMNITNRELGLTSDARLSYYEISAEWNLTLINVTVNSAQGTKDLEVEVTLHRKPTYYVVTILVPSAMLAGLILMVFALPVDCAEKLSFGITVMLTFSVFQLMLEGSVPRTSDSYPFVGMAILFLELMSALSISVSVVVLNIHHFGPILGGRMKRGMRRVVFGFLATLTCSRSLVLKHRVPENSVQPFDGPGVKFLQRGNFEAQFQKSMGRLFTSRKKNNSPTVEKLLRQVKLLTSIAQEQRNENEIIEEWKLAAMIVDRLLMIICLSVIVLVMATLMGMLLSKAYFT